RRGHHPPAFHRAAGPHLLLRIASPRSRRPAVRVGLPAPALRLPARLPGGNVHPHTAAPQRTRADGARGQVVSSPNKHQATPEDPNTASSGDPGKSGARWGPKLRERIAEEIRREGPIPFSRYMELCLYEPDLGYYSRAREQFGKAGDFYTSSDVHAVFGRLLARQFEEMWCALHSPERIDILELGPGRGLFARDVLDWSARQFPDFSRALHYGLVEQSPHLRSRLDERLSEHIEAGKAQVFDSLADAASSAGESLIVFGNEFFD